MNVIIDNKRVTLTPQMIRGSGGEADIYFLSSGTALKVYKQPNHPDHSTQGEMDAAARRIREHQQKLPAFPTNLGFNVIAPIQFAYDDSRRIVGYTMEFLDKAEQLMRYGERSFRQAGISGNDTLQIFSKLHAAVVDLHSKGIVIGDFNDLNVLVSKQSPFLIDADSMQFGQYLCRLYTAMFVDPLLCNKSLNHPELVKKHNENSDWFAFAAMLIRSLLFVSPYGGVYAPANKANKVPNPARSLHGISVFHEGVRYPKPAMPLDILPDDLLQLFTKMFESGWRGVFPADLLNMRWTTCLQCGLEHARAVCPVCAATTVVKQRVTIRGTVTATRIFKTHGIVLHATIENDKLLYLYHENYNYRREGGELVTNGILDPQFRYRIKGDDSYIGLPRRLMEHQRHEPRRQIMADYFDNLVVFDTNSRHLYWLENGKLYRDGQYAPEWIGDVLPNRTLFWAGESFGFGFYKAGKLQMAFVFDADKGGLNDSVSIPRIQGQFIDSTCVFSHGLCWFLYTVEEQGRRINRCVIIDRKGVVLAQAECEQGDPSWLGTIRGKLAAGDFMMAATDDGLVRIEASGGTLTVTQQYPDTRPFVDSGCHIFASKGGIYVINGGEIHLLTIKQ